MSKFIINGGKPLNGIIEVKGAKNAATKILAACLLTEQECVIENLPQIEDVFRMIEIMESMGARVQKEENGRIIIKAENLDPLKMNYDLVCKMRSSILLMGALVIIPALVARNIARSMRGYVVASTILGGLIAVFGVFVANAYHFLPGPTIVLFGIGCFASSLLFRKN